LKISFDPESGEFGNKADTLVHASKMGKSISFPRPSYDGNYLMYTLFNYGNFSIWHPEADLWMYNLQTGETKPMNALNSENTESYHSWSSNSKWVVFSSRRVNGLYTMPYLVHIDDLGNGSKPFLLPQKDPDFYDATFYSFNVPEFINRPVDLKINKLEASVTAGHKQVDYLTGGE
jgi:Tol biopolymer transport system component